MSTGRARNSGTGRMAKSPRPWQARAIMTRHILSFALALAASLLPAFASPATAASCGGRDLLPALAADQRAALDQAVAASPYASGNHWRAEKAGSTIDVIGTLHLYDPRMDAIAARLRPLIAAADEVWLEATDAEIARIKDAMARDPALLVTTGPTLPERLSPDEWQALSAEMSDRGIPPFMVSKFRPWYVTVLLGIPACAMADSLEGPSGLDHLISGMAKAEGTPTRALEPYDTVFRIFSTLTPEEEIDMIRLSLAQTTDAEDTFATMIESYFAENHRTLWEFSRLSALARTEDPARTAQDFARMETALLTGRNRAWAGVLGKAAPGKRLVVAVGAAHLGGSDGLLDLLEADGYSLTRAPF